MFVMTENNEERIMQMIQIFNTSSVWYVSVPKTPRFAVPVHHFSNSDLFTAARTGTIFTQTAYFIVALYRAFLSVRVASTG